MSIPTHKTSCYTRAYSTPSRGCGQAIWVFSFSFGSKVLFDELGSPWPVHVCLSLKVKEAVALIRNMDRLTNEEIYALVDKYAADHRVELSDDMLALLDGEPGKRRRPFVFTSVKCHEGPELAGGKVMEINRNINFYRRFGLEKGNLIAASVLGDPGKSPHHEIILRENPDRQNHSNQYSILVSEKTCRAAPLSPGDFILARLSYVNRGFGKVEAWLSGEYKKY